MSKKKKFAGKKTKLAELALTQALAKHPSPFAPSSDSPPISSPLTQVIQALRDRQMELDLSYNTGSGEMAQTQPLSTLDYSYEQLLQDLKKIRELLYPPGMTTSLPQLVPQGVVAPDRKILRELGRITLETLWEIKNLLG
jgi:hypothetical protein